MFERGKQLPLPVLENLAPLNQPTDAIDIWNYFSYVKDFKKVYIEKTKSTGLIIMVKDDEIEDVQRILIVRLRESGRIRKGAQILIERIKALSGNTEVTFSTVRIQREANFFEFNVGGPVDEDPETIGMIQLGLLDMTEKIFRGICKKKLTASETKKILGKWNLIH